MQSTYSQNKEDLTILRYFGAFKGNLLEIGANDGVTLSNSKLLIEYGWRAHLIEPGSVFKKLFVLHNDNENVQTHNFGIGTENKFSIFYESGAHVPNGVDTGLVSTFSNVEIERWNNVNFIKREVELKKFETFYKEIEQPTFHFISIDAEGLDWGILQQIDLDSVGCMALCIEWNSDPMLLGFYTDYCKGYHILEKNAENLIFVK